MTVVAIAPTGTASFPDGGGHWWVYLQYALGLRELGCHVLWFERVRRPHGVARALALLTDFGFGPDDVLLYGDPVAPVTCIEELEWITGSGAAARRALARAELFLDFDYATPEPVVRAPRRSALVDIDPGLLQHWWAVGHLQPVAHDHWITTGETVGTQAAAFGDTGVTWHHIRPPVHLASWPVSHADPGPFTTVTSWWGDEWLVLDDSLVLENNKRAGFAPYFELPAHTSAELEIAAYFGGASAPGQGADIVSPALTGGDRDDVAALLRSGWRLRRSHEVCGDPFAYRAYVQGSKGEFSCVKPSCVLFKNAWISDRTLCYLASGRPAVVEHTGPSEVLDTGAGVLRFESLPEAVDALAEIEAHYERHRRAARELAETYFDARRVLTDLLDHLGAPPAKASE